MFDKQDDSGVSPVIGVILMVAVTVALVVLVTVTVFDIGGDVSQSPDATVQLEQSNSDVQATLLRNENVAVFYLSYTDNTGTAQEAGDVGGADMQEAGDTRAALVDGGESGSIQDDSVLNVIAVMPDGSEEVLTSTDYKA